MSTQPACRGTTIARSFSTLRGMAERGRTDDALWDLQRRYQSLVDSLDVIIWEADAATARRTFISRQAERLLGYPVEQWLSDPAFWENRLHPADRERTVRYRTQALSGLRDHEIEYRMVALDGSVIWLRERVRVLTENGRPYKLLGLTEDVTKYKQSEQNLSRSESMPGSGQIMEAVGRLAGTVAHDLNNILTVINGYSEAILARLDDADPLRRDLLKIRDAGGRASALTQKLLDLDNRQVSRPMMLDLDSLIRGMEETLRNSIEENINLVFALNAKPCRVKADPKQIERLIAHLAANAGDAMPDGGVLIIETENVAADGTFAIRNPGMCPGSYVLLTVQDSGCGMDESAKARLFEPFFSTKEKGKGIGLGLASVYGIVQQNGGQIEVTSEAGLGTTVRIYLPGTHDVAEESMYQGLPHEKSGTRETILLADDEEIIRELGLRILRMCGYHVLEAADGVEALSIFRENQSSISLLLTDMSMPGLSGKELARQVYSIRSDAKVLYMSGYTNDAAICESSTGNRAFFLPKPFTAEGLAKKVRSVLDS